MAILLTLTNEYTLCVRSPTLKKQRRCVQVHHSGYPADLLKVFRARGAPGRLPLCDLGLLRFLLGHPIPKGSM